MIVNTSMLPGRGTTELSANPIRISPGPPSLWSIDHTENANSERKRMSGEVEKQGGSYSRPTLLEAFPARRDTSDAHVSKTSGTGRARSAEVARLICGIQRTRTSGDCKPIACPRQNRGLHSL